MNDETISIISIKLKIFCRNCMLKYVHTSCKVIQVDFL